MDIAPNDKVVEEFIYRIFHYIAEFLLFRFRVPKMSFAKFNGVTETGKIWKSFSANAQRKMER